MRAPAFLIPALTLLAACAATELEEPEPVAVAAVTCNASFYTYLVGRPIEEIYGLHTAQPVRILGPNEFVTRDYDPNRLTFTTTPDQSVGRVFCG